MSGEEHREEPEGSPTKPKGLNAATSVALAAAVFVMLLVVFIVLGRGGREEPPVDPAPTPAEAVPVTERRATVLAIDDSDYLAALEDAGGAASVGARIIAAENAPIQVEVRWADNRVERIAFDYEQSQRLRIGDEVVFERDGSITISRQQ